MVHNLSAFQTAGALFISVRFGMPQDKPGSLAEADDWAVLAFVLTHHGLLPEPVHLGPESADNGRLRR